MVAANHTAVEVYLIPLVDWNFASVVVMTTRLVSVLALWSVDRL
jgi:hypothetical protein